MASSRAKSPLFIPTPEQAVSGSAVSLIRKATSWSRKPVDMVEDLSGNSYRHSLSRDVAHRSSSVFLNNLHKTFVFGQHHFHAFIDGEDTFVCQELNHYQRRIDFHLNHHPGRDLPIPQLSREGNGIVVDWSRLGSDFPSIKEPVVFASPIEPSNWGMWLLQALPIIYKYQENRDRKTNLMIHAGAAWQKRLLDVLKVPESKIFDQRLGRTYFCDEVSLYQYDIISYSVSSEDQEIFNHLASNFAPAPLLSPRKIFVSRKSITERSGNDYRGLVEEDQLLKELSMRGFDIVEPEQLTFSEQVQIFRESNTVVGLGGAGMFNTVFCRPGTKVISIESTPAFIDNHAELFCSLGHRVGFILGERDLSDSRPVHGKWHLDVKKVIDLINAF